MCRLLLSGRRLPSNCCETSHRNVLTVIGLEPFSLLYLLHTFTSLFRNWIIPWRRISIFVAYLLCNKIVPWGRAYSLKRLPHFLPWLNHKVWIKINEVFHCTLYQCVYRSNSKCFCRLWQSKGNLYNLPPHIWCDCELFWKIKYFYD